MFYILSKAFWTNWRHVDAHKTTWWIHENSNHFEKDFLKKSQRTFNREIINLLRDKSFDEIDTFKSLFLLQRVNVLLSTFIVKSLIFLTLREMNIRLKKLEQNIAKIIFILFIYVIVTKTKNMQSVEFTIVIIATYNNIN